MKSALVAFLCVGYCAPVFASLGSAMEILKLPPENRRSVAQEKGDEVYSHFVTVAFNDDQPMNLRWRALMAASEARGEKATDDLLKAGSHDQWFMRNAALVALKEVNPDQATKLAQKLVKDKALVVRSAAVLVLEENSAPEIRELLWAELDQSYNFKNSESLWIRHQIVEALAKNPKMQELKQFAKLLSDKDVRLQSPAIQGLEKITGVRLGSESTATSKLVGLWKNYIKKESLAL